MIEMEIKKKRWKKISKKSPTIVYNSDLYKLDFKVVVEY